MAAIHAISKGQLRMQLNEVAGHAVAVYPAFRKVLGLNAAAAQFLSQAVYWTERTADGWFYKTNAEWNEETGLTVEEINGARRKLKALGLISEQRKGIPPKLHYRVDTERLLALLSGENPAINSGKTPELKVVKPLQRIPENPGVNTENTQGLQQTALSEPAPTDPRQLVEMTLSWKPDLQQLEPNARLAMVSMDRFTDDVVGSFVVHHAASGLVKTNAQWLAALVAWVKREKVKADASGGKAVDETGVPVDQIIDLYHRVCPNLPRVIVTTDKTLRGMIVDRWNEAEVHRDGKGFWLPFFEKANNRSQVFYRGQNVVPRLEALVSRAVFREISEAQQ